MLRGLPAERFKLVVHRERKQIPIYALNGGLCRRLQLCGVAASLRI